MHLQLEKLSRIILSTEKKKLKFEMERSSTNSISEDDEGDSSRNTPKHESFPAQMLPAHVETCSESAPTSESTHSRVVNSPKSKAHAQTINAAHNTNIFSTSSEEHIELMNDSGAKVEKHCNENKINRVVASCTGFGKTPPRRRVGIPSRLRQHLRSLFRGNEALQEELEADINPKKLIEKMMRDEGKSFPFPYHILEHSISDPTIEGFAVREFPLSSQMRSASTDCEPCDDCSEANDLTRDSSVMYPRQCETVGGTGEGSATHPSEAINGDRHDDVCLTDGSWVGDTSSSSVINKFDMKAATVIDKSRSEDNHVEIACNQATCDEHYDDVFHAPVSVLEGDMGNKAKSYHGDNGEDISEVRSTLRSHSYHEDAINEHIPRQMTTLNVPKDSVLSSGTGPSDARLNVGNNYTDSTIGSNYNNHRNNVTISHDDTGSDDIRSGVNGDDNSRDVTEGTVSNGDVSDDDTNEISKDQSLRRQCKQVPPLVRHNSDNEEWARRTAEAIEAIQSQVLKGADNSNGQQVGLDLGTLHDKLNGASRSCATSCSSCDLYSESSTDDDNGENGLNNITSATSILAKTVATTNKDRTQGTAVDKTTDCAPDTADNNDTFKRFYHVFCEGELVELIEKNIECLDIISAYYDHANWCVVAEKVQVWKI